LSPERWGSLLVEGDRKRGETVCDRRQQKYNYNNNNNNNPKDDLYSIHVKKERRWRLLEIEATYKEEIIKNCRIYEYKI